MELLSAIADIIGILGAVFALSAWIQTRKIREELETERRRQGKRVKVILQCGADRLELPVELRRAELTRAEILGRIGMIPMKKKGERFSLGYLNTPEFLRQINLIIASHDDALLTIPCKEEEFEQFELSS